MRGITAIGVLCVFLAGHGFAQAPDRDFSGEWQLNAPSGDHSVIPSGFLHVEQAGATMTVKSAVEEGSPLVTIAYPLDNRTVKNRVGDSTVSIATKWEGAALLVNAIVSGPEDYSINDRWSRSRDGNKLTIERSIVRRSGEKESVLVYRVAGYEPIPPPPPVSSTVEPTRPPVQTLIPRTPEAVNPNQAPPDYVVTAGTRVLLRLTNSVDTRRSNAGDRVYLQTAAPVFVNGRLIIPQGSFVIGSITESQRPGRVKGKAELNLRFETLTLPNGVARDLMSRADSVDGRSTVDSEGRIKGDGSKGRDAATIAGTTAAGAGIGSLAGAPGIGAAAGAIAGLAGVLGTRGKDLTVRQGTTMEMVLDRDLTFSSLELPGR